MIPSKRDAGGRQLVTTPLLDRHRQSGTGRVVVQELEEAYRDALRQYYQRGGTEKQSERA